MIKCDFKDSDDPKIQIEASLDLLNQINDLHKQNKTIELDFGSVNWLLPCSALLLSSRISELTAQGQHIKIIESTNNKVAKFLREIGFPLGNSSKKETHCPITHFKGNVNKEINKVLENINENLHKNFGDGVNYLIGELSDNIDAHSKFTYASLMAQYYPRKRFFDIGVLDNGLTIPGVFDKAKITFKDDCDAIRQAMEGVSTKNEGGRGFGLRTSKKVAIEGLNGEMHIYSRAGGILINPKRREKYVKLQKNPLIGTLVYMRLYIPKKRLNIYEYTE